MVTQMPCLALNILTLFVLKTVRAILVNLSEEWRKLVAAELPETGCPPTVRQPRNRRLTNDLESRTRRILKDTLFRWDLGCLLQRARRPEDFTFSHFPERSVPERREPQHTLHPEREPQHTLHPRTKTIPVLLLHPQHEVFARSCSCPHSPRLCKGQQISKMFPRVL